MERYFARGKQRQKNMMPLNKRRPSETGLRA
jgi:hypothetical protein